MLVRVDKEADAICLELSNEPIESSQEVSDGLILDYTADWAAGRCRDLAGVPKRPRVTHGRNISVGYRKVWQQRLSGR